VPRTLLLEPASAPPALPEPFRYPVVLKARRSRFWVGEGWQSGEVVTVREPAQWADALRAPGMAGGALLQEFVPGHGEGVVLLARGGETLVRFGHKRLREKPPTGGVSVLSESVRPDPKLLAFAEALLAALRWTGVTMVRSRAPDGRAVLIESTAALGLGRSRSTRASTFRARWRPPRQPIGVEPGSARAPLPLATSLPADRPPPPSPADGAGARACSSTSCAALPIPPGRSPDDWRPSPELRLWVRE
jgi:hypothetical protein